MTVLSCAGGPITPLVSSTQPAGSHEQGLDTILRTGAPDRSVRDPYRHPEELNLEHCPSSCTLSKLSCGSHRDSFGLKALRQRKVPLEKLQIEIMGHRLS